MNQEIQRIRNDLARAKERVAQIESGQRGVRSGPWLETDGSNPGAGLAHSAQLRAQCDAVARLEFEYVMAMIPSPWGPAEIIERMSAAPPAAVAPIVQVVEKTVVSDVTRERLAALLAEHRFTKFIPISKLQELIST